MLIQKTENISWNKIFGILMTNIRMKNKVIIIIFDSLLCLSYSFNVSIKESILSLLNSPE